MLPPRRAALAALALAAAALAGCPPARPRYATVADARAAAVAARDAARAARDARDPGAAAAAAERAEEALRQAQALTPADAAPVRSAANPLAELQRAAREARLLAEETDERQRLDAQLTGLKARAYRQVRSVALAAAFKALAQAAREADARGLDALPPQAREAAETAAGWAQATTRRAPRTDGSPDWAGIAADLEATAAKPPQELAVPLAVGYFALGRTGLALLEAEGLDPLARTDPLERLALYLLRALVRSANGYRRLAVLEAEAGLTGAGLRDTPLGAPGGVPLTGAQLVGGLHLVLATVHVHEKDYAAADVELAAALAAWPDSPVATFLTGERLLASGERERAAESLEAAARGEGEDAEWLAARVAERARAIRDGRAEPGTGLVGDPTFMARLALHGLWRAAERSEEAARLKAEVERGRALGRDVLARLPGLGGDAATGDAAPVASSP